MYLQEVVNYLNALPLDEIIDLVQKSLEYTYELEMYVAYPNDYITFKELYVEPIDAVRATFYGDYRYTDDYIIVNALGNIDSYDSVALKFFYTSIMEEIAEVVIEYDLMTE